MVNIAAVIDADDSSSSSKNPVATTAKNIGAGQVTVIKVGTKVKIHGLKTASQHNGKIGVVVQTAPTPTTATGNNGKDGNEEQRVGVKLLPVQQQDGIPDTTKTTKNSSSKSKKVLAVKLNNLEVVGEEEKTPTTPRTTTTSTNQQQQKQQQQKQRELKRQVGLLEEFDGSFEYDPNTLVLYYHLRDQAFDCFNSKEYQTQLVNYLNHDMVVRLVLPRQIRQHKYWLIGLQSVDGKTGKPTQHNVLCDVAFQAGRSFTGISMLVKHRCFHCGNPNPTQVELCTDCSCVCFCKSCHATKPQTWIDHKQLVCDRIDKSKIIMETECIQLLL